MDLYSMIEREDFFSLFFSSVEKYYKEALDISIKATSRVDEKIYRKLMSVYEK